MEQVRRISVRVIAHAKRRDISMSPDGTLIVKVLEPAEGGRANAALLEALAKHFSVPKSRLTILQGAGFRQKLVEIAPSPV